VPAGRVALWVTSAVAIALCVRSIVLGPVPLPLALGALGLYLGFVLVGVLVPQLEIFGDAISRGDPTTHAVALTFDDGPHPETTPRVLALLAQAGVKATFFVVGEKVERHPDVARAIARAGHTFGAHGHRHRRLYAFLSPTAVARDIDATVQAVERATGVRPRWFRPPVGQVSPRTAAGAKRAGLEIVVWSVRGLDGLAATDPDRVVTRVERGLAPGAIILLHDAAERDDFIPASVHALPRVLECVARKGLRVVPLGELLGEG
jgi:peptidoglycan-N-acetylglucosamine deacetylase